MHQVEYNPTKEGVGQKWPLHKLDSEFLLVPVQGPFKVPERRCSNGPVFFMSGMNIDFMSEKDQF